MVNYFIFWLDFYFAESWCVGMVWYWLGSWLRIRIRNISLRRTKFDFFVDFGATLFLLESLNDQIKIDYSIYYSILLFFHNFRGILLLIIFWIWFLGAPMPFMILLSLVMMSLPLTLSALWEHGTLLALTRRPFSFKIQQSLFLVLYL